MMMSAGTRVVNETRRSVDGKLATCAEFLESNAAKGTASAGASRTKARELWVALNPGEAAEADSVLAQFDTQLLLHLLQRFNDAPVHPCEP